jgi:hypothetical protein
MRKYFPHYPFPAYPLLVLSDIRCFKTVDMYENPNVYREKIGGFFKKNFK